MTKKQRFINTIERKPVDRPAVWLGVPDVAALPALYKCYGVDNYKDFKLAVGDDVWTVELPYHSPTSDAIYAAFDFADHNIPIEERTLTSAGFFQNYSEASDVDRFAWPDATKYIDPAECKRIVDEVPEGYPIMGVIWSSHFQDACAAFGMEDALMKMLTAPELFHAVIDKIVDFYLTANGIFYEATKGKLDAVLIGNDFGTQTGLICSPRLLRQYVFEGTKKLVDQAHSYGLKVIHHSCGAVSGVIPDIIATGADVVHPIQALATGMEPQGLKDQFGDKTSFAGGVDAQHLLVNGTPEEVAQKAKQLAEIFPTGLIISPSHEAILTDVPPANIKALFDAIVK